MASPLAIGLLAVIFAGAAVLVSIIAYIWAPKKIVFASAFLIYLLLIATSVSLIISSGNSTSPFIAFWMLLVIFSGVFGIWGLLPIIITAGFYVAYQYLNSNLTSTEIIITVFSTLLPMIASVIIWHNKSDKDNSEEKAYKSLSNELSEVANKSEVVINAIGDGVMSIDGQGIIQLINPAAQQIIGWGKQDALALNYKSILHLVDQKSETIDAASDPIQQALNINQQVRANLNLLTNSGKNLTISLVVSPVGTMGSGVIVVFRDVTKEKAEEREQAEFISTASHEMRTPVASIEGYLGLALNPQTSQIDDRARDFILKAHASAEHLGHLFQDLLDVTKTDDGRISNNPKVVDIVTFTAEITKGLEQKAIDKGLKLAFKPTTAGIREKHVTPVYYINLDNDHVREILDNLIENAIKYTPQGDVMVDISGTEDHVVVSVKDSGIGIPTEDMPHLFQKFYRVDNKDTRDIGGTGLGLYLSRRLAEVMGGRIWAESVYGSGSTFFLELPRVDNQEANLLIEQESFKAQQEASQAALTQSANPTTGAFIGQPMPITVNTVSTPQTPTAATAQQPIFRTQQTLQPVMPQSAPAQQIQRPVAPQYQAPQPFAAPTTRPMTTPVMPQQPAMAVKPATSVPRGQALTPEQIAAYVAKQRALAMKQQSAPQPRVVQQPQPIAAATPQTMQRPTTPQPVTPRPQEMTIPIRRVNQ
ncbi:MAG: ATP-binding protein [Candidatus Saccharimonadales bacterium]